jgi:hypothetical protein
LKYKAECDEKDHAAKRAQWEKDIETLRQAHQIEVDRL